MDGLATYRDLESIPAITAAEMHSLVASLPESYWEDMSQMLETNAKEAESLVRSTTPSYEDMHRPFDL